LPTLVGFLEHMSQSARRVTMITAPGRCSRGMTFAAALLLVSLGIVAFTGDREAREIHPNGAAGAPALEKIAAAGAERIDRLKVAWGFGFDLWSKQVWIYSYDRDPAEQEEVMDAEWAVVEFEGDRAVLTLKDRKLQYGIPDRRDREATEDSSLASVEFEAGYGVTLGLTSGERVKYDKAFFQVAPTLGTVLARECTPTGPLWEKYYER